MLASQEKSELFLSAIREHLESRRKDIEDEVSAVHRDEQKKAACEAAQLSEEFIRTQTDRIRALANRDYAALEMSLRGELAAARETITREVFDAAAKTLQEFTLTPAYREFLKRSVADICRRFSDKPLTLYLNPAHLSESDAVREMLTDADTIEADESILIGGCKASSTHSALRVDDTLDARLEALKQEFYEFSGLSVQLR